MKPTVFTILDVLSDHELDIKIEGDIFFISEDISAHESEWQIIDSDFKEWLFEKMTYSKSFLTFDKEGLEELIKKELPPIVKTYQEYRRTFPAARLRNFLKNIRGY